MNKKNLDQIADVVEGIPVYSVMAGFPSERAGIRVGDILLEVNGHRTINAIDYINAVKHDHDGIRTYKVWRKGLEFNVEISVSSSSNKSASVSDVHAAMQNGSSTSGYILPNADSTTFQWDSLKEEDLN